MSFHCFSCQLQSSLFNQFSSSHDRYLLNQNKADKAVRKKKRAVTPTILELSTEKSACLQFSLQSFSFSFMIKTTKMLAILKANPPPLSPPHPHLQCRLTMPLSHNLVSSFRSFFTHVWVTGGCYKSEI